MRMLLPILFLYAVSISCNNSESISLSRQDLFTLNFGKMENQFDFFIDRRSPRTSQNSIFYDDGLFYITNGNASKLMEFTLFGEIAMLLYNPSQNPLPVMLKNSGSEAKGYEILSRRAIPVLFQDIGVCAVDNYKNLYIVDRVPDNSAQGTPFRSIIKRFDRFGNPVDFIGRSGKEGLPFPAIENIYLTNQNHLVVVCRTAKGSTVYWLDSDGRLLYEIEFDHLRFPVPKDSDFIPSLGKIVPDYNEKKLYIMISYFQNLRDETTGLVSRVNHMESRIYIFDLVKEQYDGRSLTIPAETAAASDPLFGKGKQQGSVPYDFLGVDEKGDCYLIKIRNKTPSDLAVISFNRPPKRIRLFFDETNVIAIDINIAKTGLLYALITEMTCARVVLWRSDQTVLRSM